MLHFVIGLAVCIWIAERVTHYIRSWREQRRQISNMRRGMRLLYPHVPGEQIDKNVDDRYGIRRKAPRSDGAITAWLCGGFAVLLLAIAIFH